MIPNASSSQARAPGTELSLDIPEPFGVLLEPYRYKAFYGGRGGAKSHSFARVLLTMGLEKSLRILCCREIQKSIATSVKQLLDDLIEEMGLSWFYTSTDRKIIGLNGTQFLFAGLRTNPHSVKSMEGIDIAWVEEANTVSQTSLDLLIPTVRKKGSEIWFSWNRRLETDPVDNMFLGGPKPPNSVVMKVNWDDNPWFPDVLYDEMMWDKSRDIDKYNHIWLGEPVSRSEARVFQNWRIDDLDDRVGDTTPRLGADWGFSTDPTALIRVHLIGERTLYIAQEAVKVRCEIDETPALFAGNCTYEKDHPRYWTNAHGHPGLQAVRDGHRVVADSARPETISYMKKRGFSIVGARKGAGSVEEGVEFLKSYDIVVHPSCIHAINELTLYSYKIDKLTDEVLPELADKDNHVIDAIRYALENARKRMRGNIATVAPEAIEQRL